MSRRIDLTGNRYGRLLVTKFDRKNQHGDTYWVCRCDCGNYKSIASNKLRSGWTKSCGCLHKEIMRQKLLSHGMSKSKLYSSWELMKSRCYYPQNNRYYRYGGRGIKVCDEWLSFERFKEWALKNGYKEGLTLERKNIDKNYEPDNCCWITKEEQARNKCNTVWVVYKGERMCMSVFAREMGVSINVISNRIKKGMNGDEMAKEFLNEVS